MSSAEAAGPARRPRRGIAVRVITWTATLLALWFLWRTLRDVGLQNLGARLRSVDPLLATAAVLLTGVRFLTIAWRWEILLRREAPLGLRRIAPVLMAGNFVSLVTPVMRIAGPILRAFYLSRETGLPRARFYGTIVADQTANFAAFTVAMSISGVMVGLPEPWRISPWSGLGMLAALVGGLWAGARMLRQVHGGAEPRVTRFLTATLGPGGPWSLRRRTIDWFDHLTRALASSLIGTGAWWPALALSGIATLMLAAVQIVAWAAVGTTVGLAEGVFAVAGAGFIQMMSAAPGGPGLTEASLILVAMALGIDRESAVVGVFLARFANYLVILAWGGPAFLALQRRYGLPREDAGPAAA
jgi:uncharacterized membrane protein YbhN (UPF0104 family)